MLFLPPFFQNCRIFVVQMSWPYRPFESAKLFNVESKRKSYEIKLFQNFLWLTVQDSHPSYGFRVLFLHVLQFFFVLEMRCVVPPESL